MIGLPRRSFVGGITVAGLASMSMPSRVWPSPADQLRVGIFPYLTALKIEQLYSPLAVAFEQRLGCKVLLRTRGSFDEFRDALLQEQFDVALMHPFMFVDMQQQIGMRPLVRVDQDLQAVILARNDFGCGGFADLYKKVLALPPRLSGVSYLALRSLAMAGLTPGVDVTVRHFQWKTSCVHAVASGEADGCAIPTFLLKQSHLIDKMGLRPVAHTSSVPGLLMATRAGLPPTVSESLKLEMLSWETGELGQTLLAGLGWPGLRPAIDSDYDVIRSFGSSQIAEAAG